jgi:hypothetical protein
MWPRRRVPVSFVLAAIVGPAIAAARQAADHPESRRMVRGALLTPWAAVSLGIVVAASLTLATPRAVLTFPPTAPARCQAKACGLPDAGRGRPLPTAKLGTRFPPIHTVPAGGLASSSATPAPPGPVEVQYALLPRYGNHHFVAVIVITSSRALGDWTLRFAIPGTQIRLVMWAKWTPYGKDGGIVGGSAGESPSSGPNRARIVIMGTGAPGRPRDCVFDGNRCTFRDFNGGFSHFKWQSSDEDGH